jgi:hypothetical protein
LRVGACWMWNAHWTREEAPFVDQLFVISRISLHSHAGPYLLTPSAGSPRPTLLFSSQHVTWLRVFLSRLLQDTFIITGARCTIAYQATELRVRSQMFNYLTPFIFLIHTDVKQNELQVKRLKNTLQHLC